MDRKSFLTKVGALVLAGIPLISLWSCSNNSEDDMEPDDDMDPDETAKNCVENGTSVSIGSNHGHSLSVSKEDIIAGAEKTYDITGSGGHEHSVTVTAAHFTSLKDNANVTVESTSSGHTHLVTITCA